MTPGERAARIEAFVRARRVRRLSDPRPPFRIDEVRACRTSVWHNVGGSGSRHWRRT